MPGTGISPVGKMEPPQLPNIFRGTPFQCRRSVRSCTSTAPWLPMRRGHIRSVSTPENEPLGDLWETHAAITVQQEKPHKPVSACRAFPSLSVPGRNRTCDLLLRRQSLYPTELRGQVVTVSQITPYIAPLLWVPITRLGLLIGYRQGAAAPHPVYSAMMNVAVESSVKAAEIRSLSGTSSSIRSAHRRKSANRHIPLVGCPRGWQKRSPRQRRNLVLGLRLAPTRTYQIP